MIPSRLLVPLFCLLLVIPASLAGQSLPLDSIPPQFQISVGEGEQGLHVSGAVGVVLMMGIMTLLPSLVLMMTSFTRIIIVLHLLRQAIGTATSPPTMLLGALAVLLTFFIMSPTLEAANDQAIQPYLAGEMTQAAAITAGLDPFRDFMFSQTTEENLGLFMEMSGRDAELMDDRARVPTTVLMSAFVTSELKTAFFLGFMIFLPFLIIDLIVASVLMGLGVFMLPPALVSLPFKLLLFVLADGWFNLIGALVQGYAR